jgi:hypothetical protein
MEIIGAAVSELEAGMQFADGAKFVWGSIRSLALVGRGRFFLQGSRI